MTKKINILSGCAGTATIIGEYFAKASYDILCGYQHS
jgi:hypothetical protein